MKMTQRGTLPVGVFSYPPSLRATSAAGGDTSRLFAQQPGSRRVGSGGGGVGLVGGGCVG